MRTNSKNIPNPLLHATYNLNMKFALAIAATMLVSATAFCPNACSGHGQCQQSPKDSCACFTRREQEYSDNALVAAWTGADCSLRE